MAHRYPLPYAFARSHQLLLEDDGTRLTLTADGQTPLRLQPIEERRFIADEAPELNVAFAGRGGIIERLSEFPKDAAQLILGSLDRSDDARLSVKSHS